MCLSPWLKTCSERYLAFGPGLVQALTEREHDSPVGTADMFLERAEKEGLIERGANPCSDHVLFKTIMFMGGGGFTGSGLLKERRPVLFGFAPTRKLLKA